MNPNRRINTRLRPLASIPNKDGAVIVGVRADGSEALLTVYVDQADGLHKVPEYSSLIGWRLP